MNKVIRNDIVKKDWDADLFFETNEGFFAAIHEYESADGKTVPVVFQENNIYLLYDVENDCPAETSEVCEAIKEAYKEKEGVEVLYEENYIELGNDFVSEDDTLLGLGLSSEQIDDINARKEDINNYWDVNEFEM